MINRGCPTKTNPGAQVGTTKKSVTNDATRPSDVIANERWTDAVAPPGLGHDHSRGLSPRQPGDRQVTATDDRTPRVPKLTVEVPAKQDQAVDRPSDDDQRPSTTTVNANGKPSSRARSVAYAGLVATLCHCNAK